MGSKNVLLIDDEASILKTLSNVLIDEGYLVLTASSGAQGLELLKSTKVDMVLLDIWMPGQDGIEVLKQIKTDYPEQLVVMMSGHGNIETAVKATKYGAYDFIEKPLSLEKILVLLQNAFTAQDLSKENSALRKQIQKQHQFIGKTQIIEKLKEMVKRVAPTTGSVLITGENGTGKEVLANTIHTLSTRFSKPFIEVNCAAIPEELIESELFGHEKGSFTGATQMRRGKFDLANGGTLFLDEIGDMSLKTQAKILRILQEQKFERVGGTQSHSVDVRIIAATNKDLKSEMNNGQFREDLFYRLNVVPFHVPPLRERKEDIPLLANHFLKQFSESYQKPYDHFSEEAVKVLKNYNWPGNVRELKNLIERIIILSTDVPASKEITATELLMHLSDVNQEENKLTPSPHLSDTRNFKDARFEFEREFILKSLKENEWNISKTAQILGIERSYLHRKIKTFGIEEGSSENDVSDDLE